LNEIENDLMIRFKNIIGFFKVPKIDANRKHL
jgi:hypothetical protein